MVRSPLAVTDAGRAGYWALARGPADALLGLDYDGTLAPIVLDPADARPQPGARQALTAAAGVFGRVAVVSGRSVASLVELLELTAADAPAIDVVGVHGREIRPSPRNSDFRGRPRSSTASPGRGHSQEMAWARGELAAAVVGLPVGVRIEDKGHSLGVHFRGCAEPAAALAQSEAVVRGIARRCGLDVLAGRLVLELIVPGPDKGSVLRELATGVGAVCFVGDDLADLAAFAVVDELRAAGVPGLKIAVSNAESPVVARAADLVLGDPAEVVAFLAELTRSGWRGC